jgi:hypothetical protein
VSLFLQVVALLELDASEHHDGWSMDNREVPEEYDQSARDEV